MIERPIHAVISDLEAKAETLAGHTLAHVFTEAANTIKRVHADREALRRELRATREAAALDAMVA